MCAPGASLTNKLRILQKLTYMLDISKSCSFPIYKKLVRLQIMVRDAFFEFQLQEYDRILINIWNKVPVEMIQNKENSNEENLTNFFIMYEDIVEDILDSILA